MRHGVRKGDQRDDEVRDGIVEWVESAFCAKTICQGQASLLALRRLVPPGRLPIPLQYCPPSFDDAGFKPVSRERQVPDVAATQSTHGNVVARLLTRLRRGDSVAYVP